MRILSDNFDNFVFLLNIWYKELVGAYFVEAQWFRGGYLPTFKERLKNAILSSVCVLDPATVLLGLEEEIVGMNAIQSLIRHLQSFVS